MDVFPLGSFAQDENTWYSVPESCCLFYCHSAPTLSPKRHLPLGHVTDWKSSVSIKRMILQFILQHDSVRLGSSSGASWTRATWALSWCSGSWETVHILFTMTFASTSCILLRQCIIKIKIISLKGAGREKFLKGTMLFLCLLPRFTGPLISNWVKGGEKGD